MPILSVISTTITSNKKIPDNKILFSNKYKKEVNFVDDLHLTSHGNEIIANEIMLSVLNDVKLLANSN